MLSCFGVLRWTRVDCPDHGTPNIPRLDVTHCFLVPCQTFPNATGSLVTRLEAHVDFPDRYRTVGCKIVNDFGEVELQTLVRARDSCVISHDIDGVNEIANLRPQLVTFIIGLIKVIRDEAVGFEVIPHALAGHNAAWWQKSVEASRPTDLQVGSSVCL